MSVSSNKSTGVTEDQVNTQVDNALNTAIPGSNTTDSVNDILLDKLEPRLPTGGTISILTEALVNSNCDTAVADGLNVTIPGTNNTNSVNDILLDKLVPVLPASDTISTLTAANINTQCDTAVADGLNVTIPGSNNTNSVNDILLDKLVPVLPPSATISTLTGANIEDQCDNALDNAVTTSKTANSIGYRVASMHDRQKMKWQWAASYILLGSAGSSGEHAVVDLDNKEGFLSCVDLFVDSGVAGAQADSAFTLNVELNDTASTAVSLCASGLFNTYWKANRMWSATVSQNAAGVADCVRFPINLPFTSTTDALKVYINLTAGSGGGAVFLMVNYGEVI